MNTQNNIISENLVISQPLYDNDLAAQSIYDKYLRECSLIPIASVQESKETSERPFAGTRQNSQNPNPRNQHNIQEYNSLEPEFRNRPQQQIQQQRQHHRNLYQNHQDQNQYYEQINYQRNYNIYYHQRQNNLVNHQIQNQHHNPYQQNQHNFLNYRAEQEYYGQHIRRLEQDRRRKNRLPKYGLDQGEIAALSEINYRQSRAQCWDDENKKCSICISHFEENEKIRFLPCLHRFHSNCVDSWLQTKGSCPLCKKYVRCLVQQFQ